MDKKRILLIVSASVAMFMYSFALLALGVYFGTTINPPYQSNVQAQSQIPTRYIIKEHHNLIAVFVYGSDVPQKVLNIDVNSLRRQDRLKFQEGIVVNSNEELAQLEEDFSS